MVLPKIALEAASIVIRGSFNPAIFSPSWFLLQKLVGKGEVDEANVEAILPQVASMRLGWLQLNVQTEAIQVTTEAPDEYERLRDLAVGILGALPGTPISQLGINRQGHFAVPTAAEWHAVGDSLVRNDIWDDVLALPGMADLTIWGIRPDKYTGRVQVQVQPSAKIDFGVYVAYNDHYDLTIADSQPKSRDEFSSRRAGVAAVPASTDKAAVAVEILTNQWAESMRRAQLALRKVAEQKERTS